MKDENNVSKLTETQPTKGKLKWIAFQEYMESKWLDYVDALEARHQSTTPGISPDILSMSANSIAAICAYRQSAPKKTDQDIEGKTSRKP